MLSPYKKNFDLLYCSSSAIIFKTGIFHDHGRRSGASDARTPASLWFYSSDRRGRRVSVLLSKLGMFQLLFQKRVVDLDLIDKTH